MVISIVFFQSFITQLNLGHFSKSWVVLNFSWSGLHKTGITCWFWSILGHSMSKLLYARVIRPATVLTILILWLVLCCNLIQTRLSSSFIMLTGRYQVQIQALSLHYNDKLHLYHLSHRSVHCSETSGVWCNVRYLLPLWVICC